MKSKTVENRARRVLVILGSLLFLAVNATGQQLSWSPTDNGKSAAFALPNALGTDEVNLYNGRVAFNMPVGTVGGRGEAKYQPYVSISRTFVVRNAQDIMPKQVYWWTQPPTNMIISENYMDSYDYSDFQPGLLPAVLIVRRTRDQHPTTFSTSSDCQTLTKIYLRMPGNEIELRDILTNGEPDHDDGLSPFNRGRAWHSVDGLGTYFLSDTEIKDVSCGDRDWPAMNNAKITKPSGYLFLSNGLRYRFVNGFPVWMRDKNGNSITFGPPNSQPPSLVTDSIGRQYGINFDGFSYKGVDGTTRIVGIESGLLEGALRPDIVAAGGRIRREEELFPTISFLRGPANLFNPSVIKAVRLPNGMKYRFFYNEYGELSRIEMPTGGIVEYDYPELGVGPINCDGNSPCNIHRPVKEKRLYDSPNHLISRVTFEYEVTDANPADTIARVKTLAPDGQIVHIERHTFKGNVRSDFKFTGWYQAFDNGRELSVEMLDDDGETVLRRTDNKWATLDANGAPIAPPQGTWTHPTNFDCALTEVKTTLETSQISQQTFRYDGFGNQTDLYEYGFGAVNSGAAGPLIRRTHTDYLKDTAYTGTSGAYILNLPSKKWVSTDLSGGNMVSLVDFEYDNYTSSGTDIRHAALVNRSNIFGLCLKLDDTGVNCLETADSSHDNRGNLTQATGFFDIPGNGSIQRSIQYDIAGNAVAVIDGRGYATKIFYDDAFGSNDGVVRTNTAPSELNGRSAFAFATSTTNAADQTSFAQYNFYIGVPVDSEDVNGNVTSFEYGKGAVGATNVDPLDRPSRVIRAVNSPSSKAQTRYLYDDSKRITTTTSDLSVYGDNVLKNEILYDAFGRTNESRQYEGGSNYIAVQTEYDALGRAFRSSNPFRPWQNEDLVWTTTGFDILGRVISVTTPDNAVVRTNYSGNSMTVTDQAGKQRKIVTDAQGRLIQVYEDPNGSNFLTTYSYDALDNLIKVNQGAQIPRTFAYDSLSRLLSATNPESGTVCYGTVVNSVCQKNGYDANGNRILKTDARGIQISYVYDELNRLTTRSYNDGTAPNYTDRTPSVTYTYDSTDIANGKGRLASVSSSVSTYSYGGYDAIGRILSSKQVIGSQNYVINYVYNLAGHVKTMTYPSGRTVTNTFDAAGRLNSFIGKLGDGIQRTYSTGVTYSSFGGLTQEQFGTNPPTYNKRRYNIRGQLFDMRLSSVNDTWDWNRGRLILYYSSNHLWSQSGADNNGNVLFAETWIPPVNATLDQADTLTEDSYTYDSLNRLTSVAEQRMSVATGWGNWQQQFRQQYTYDRYGNRTINTAQTSGTGINKNQFTVDTATNRLGVPAGQTGVMTYDSAGNLTMDTYTGTGARIYDAENRMKQAWANNQWQTYVYDGDGARIKRTVNGIETWQIYGLGGELLAEYGANGAATNPQKEFGYRNGELLIAATVTSGWGAPPLLSDQPLNPVDQPRTEVKAIHITQLRAAIDALRLHYNLPSYQWRKPVASGGVINNNVFISWEPIDEMRTALNEALGPPVNGYTAGLAANQPILAAHIQELRDRVLAAWQSAGAINVHWLVADHLGTPRTILDQSGLLANISRHDYLPFGEELFAGTGGRTPGQGYTGNDGARQQFTGQERDDETNLDFFVSRYYSSILGRFNSADSILGKRNNPQSLNLYTYVINNPLRFNDPLGFSAQDPQRPQDPQDEVPGIQWEVTTININDAQQRYQARMLQQRKMVLCPIGNCSPNTLLDDAKAYVANQAAILFREVNKAEDVVRTVLPDGVNINVTTMWVISVEGGFDASGQVYGGIDMPILSGWTQAISDTAKGKSGTFGFGASITNTYIIDPSTRSLTSNGLPVRSDEGAAAARREFYSGTAYTAMYCNFGCGGVQHSSGRTALVTGLGTPGYFVGTSQSFHLFTVPNPFTEMRKALRK